MSFLCFVMSTPLKVILPRKGGRRVASVLASVVLPFAPRVEGY
ncbi:MAG: hypothetical protein QXZ16_02895 [Ignisphaera sp.]